MSVQRPSEMSRDELESTVDELQETVENLETLVHVQIEKRKDLEATVDDLVERVDTLEAENERLRDRLDDSSSKGQKVAQIVEFATNIRDGQAVVKLSATNIKGATGCSRRYAYDLIDDLPDEYDWALSKAEMRQYGDIQLKNNSDAKTLGIDFEGVHSAGVPVNKFTTPSEKMEGSE